MIEKIYNELAQAVNEYNAKKNNPERITAADVFFDDSRAWSLYVYGIKLGLTCNKFGAYRPYLGGGVRGAMDHNGRDQDGTTALGNTFANALRKIEKLYNDELSPDASESWDLASGVLL